MSDTTWDSCQLFELLNVIKSGGTPDTNKSDFYGGEIPFVAIDDLTSCSKFLEGTSKHLTVEGVNGSNAWLVPIGAILYSIYATLGVVRITAIPVTTNQAILAMVVDSSKIDQRYLYQWLTSIRSSIGRYSSQTTQSNLNASIVKSFKISFPKSLTQQRRIAEILSTVDDAIEATEALIAKQQQIKAGLMHDLFTRGVWTAGSIAAAQAAGSPAAASAKPGQLRPCRETAPELYKESPLGWIPKDWEVRSLGDCAAKSSGSTTIGPFGSDLVASDYRSEGVPVIFVRDVKENAFFWKSGVYVTKNKAMDLAAHAVRSGDVLATKMGLPPCVACLYPDELVPGIITADMVRLRPDLRSMDPTWLTSAINSDAVKKQVLTITAGVTRPKITLSDFRKLKAPCPTLIEQTLAVGFIDAEKSCEDAERCVLDNLKKQKQGLMQDLLSGEVKVMK